MPGPIARLDDVPGQWVIDRPDIAASARADVAQVLGVVISAFFLALALRGIDLEGFWTTVRHANYWWLIPGVTIYFGAVWARTWRWHYMLRHIKQIPMRRLFPVVVIGYMGNNVYPARAGEVLRS